MSGSRGTRDGAPRSLVPGALLTRADAYQDLLRDTRGLRREQATARESWLAGLAPERREEALFELETLLKGLACFANPRNHPGLPRRAAVVSQDYREALLMAREGMSRVAQLCRLLLGERDRDFVFQRYLEMLVPDDGTRSRLVEGGGQATPEQSLLTLRQGITNLVEVARGVTRLPRVPFRLFYATMASAQREIGQSVFFNPLTALEFRPEFDRITNARVLEVMRHAPGEHARRLVALTFLGLFRLLRYLALLERVARDARPGLAYLVLSVLRSEARTLTDHLRKRAGEELAESFDRELFKVPAAQMAARQEQLRAQAHRLLEIKATLGGIAANIRLELRRSFEHEIAAPDANVPLEQLRETIAGVVGNLRPALQNAILLLGTSLGERLDEHGVFDDAAARRALGERLRRDVWMFSQIVRAFAAKARTTPSSEQRWSGPSSLQFVREFLSYFEAMGYPLLRAADYPRFDVFRAAVTALEETDLLDPDRLGRAVSEAEQFHGFLMQLFEGIGQRDELRGVPFNRRAAAASLRLYLGD
jgi:hypothetical protein